MQPFAQDQNRSNSRRWLLLVVATAAFGVWFFDLLPDLLPVESGNLSGDAATETPELPESWDVIVDHFQEAAAVEAAADTSDPLLAAIADPGDSLNAVLTELSEPDPIDTEGLSLVPESRTSDTDRQIRSASFSESGANSGPDVVLAVVSRESPPVLSAEAAAVLRSADEFLRQDQIVEAHAELSRLYWKHPEERPLFLRRIEATASQIFSDPHRHFGRPYLVMPGDTLESIGRQYSVPWTYLSRLNRLEPEDLQAGQELKILRGPFSAVVDLNRFELTVHAHGYFVHRYEIGIGCDGRTPPGEFTVQEKVENPTWYNPDGGVVDRNDPQNPLGEYWIGLGNQIGIHGTIDPDSIGTARSRGCIHMRDADIVEVFELLGESSAVRIRE